MIIESVEIMVLLFYMLKICLNCLTQTIRFVFSFARFSITKMINCFSVVCIGNVRHAGVSCLEVIRKL